MSAIAPCLPRKADEQVECTGWIVDWYVNCKDLELSMTDSLA